MHFISSIVGKGLLGVAAAGAVFAPMAAIAHDNSSSTSDKKVSAVQSVDVAIGAAGRVLVHGAKVTGINGSTMTATTNWGGTTITWSVNDASAKILYKGGKNADTSVIAVNDVVNFEGTLSSTSAFAVVATIIRDTSKEKAVMEKHTFSGTLSTLPGSTTPTTFHMTVGSTDYTVNVPSGISILGKTWLTLPIGSFVVGDKVNVYGAVEASSTNTIDATVVRNSSR